MPNGTIPEDPAIGGRVFIRLTRNRLEALAESYDSYRRALRLVDAIDAGWTKSVDTRSVEAILIEENVHLVGFEALVENDSRGPLFPGVVGTIGLLAIWVKPTVEPQMDNLSLYAFTLQGPNGPTSLFLPSMTKTIGSVFVAHYAGVGPAPIDWCRQLALSNNRNEVTAAAPVSGEFVAHDSITASKSRMLSGLTQNVWYAFGGDLILSGGDNTTVEYNNVRYRHFEWLLKMLDLKPPVRIKQPHHEWIGLAPRWHPEPIDLSISGTFTLTTSAPPSRKKLTVSERRRLHRLNEQERMRRLRRLRSPTGTRPGDGGYLESTEGNRKAFVEYFEQAIPSGLSITPINLMELSSDVTDENPNFHELPPRDLWPKMVPTLALLSKLEQATGVSFEALSVYRSDIINALSGGVFSSPHRSFVGLDVGPLPQNSQEKFEAYVKHYWWTNEAKQEKFGLGFYRRGRVHIDTDGHRRWKWNEETRQTSERRYKRFFNK